MRVLDYFRRGNFEYTLTPPLLDPNSIDDLLFRSHEGFCGHYRVGLRDADACRRRTGTGRDRLSRGAVESVRTLPAGAPGGRACLDRGVARRTRLDARGSDVGRGPRSPDRRVRSAGRGGLRHRPPLRSAAVDAQHRTGLAGDECVVAGPVRELQFRQAARPAGLARASGPRLARARAAARGRRRPVVRADRLAHGPVARALAARRPRAGLAGARACGARAGRPAPAP